MTSHPDYSPVPLADEIERELAKAKAGYRVHNIEELLIRAARDIRIMQETIDALIAEKQASSHTGST